MRRLTDLEARTLRWMATASGFATAPDPAVAATLRELISTEFAAVTVTVAGHQALAEYDRAKPDLHAERLARGMSTAGRAALQPEGERSDG